ncbi:hypothetical protein SNE40_007200 [Patella caerulea]|uniref:Uncharacterized protein n=1 Tax=Patella caerulea TaxID=87958 RepID=A0AAN8JXG2_PATCE
MEGNAIWFSSFLIVCLVSLINCIPVPEYEDKILNRHTRNADDLKIELQKLRRILQDVHDHKSDLKIPTTTTTTTTSKPTVDDDIYNKLIIQLRNSDQATLMKLAQALKQLKTEEESNPKSLPEKNSVGGVIQEKSVSDDTNDDDRSKTQKKIFDALKKIGLLEENKNNQEVTETESVPGGTSHEIEEDEYDSFRREVLHALEQRLLKDVGLALQYGFDPKDIIKDLQERESIKKTPRSTDTNIEKELSKMRNPR